MRRRRRAQVIDIELYRERRRRMQAACGHSMVHRGRCSYCGGRVPAHYDQLPMFEPGA